MQLVRKMEGAMKNVTVEILKDCGHWHVYEDVGGVAKAVKAFFDLEARRQRVDVEWRLFSLAPSRPMDGVDLPSRRQVCSEQSQIEN